MAAIKEPTVGFLTANGSKDTHVVTLKDGKPNRSKQAGKPYSTVTWGEIRQLVETPTAVPKDRARFVILSTYVDPAGRKHAAQRDHGSFHGLAVDIDKGNHGLQNVVNAVNAVTGRAAAEVYSSSSSTAENRKWRVLIPLAEPVAGADYGDTQTALFRLLAERGIECDETLSRAGQPIYLPNVPPEKRDADGSPIFYAFRHVHGDELTLKPDHPIVVEREALRRQRAADEAAAEKRRAEYQARRLEHVQATGDDFDPIRHFNETHTTADMLTRYGFVRQEGGPGSHWKSPLSTSGTYSTEDCGDGWRTVSNWARAHRVGREGAGGVWHGDAFDLFVHFDHGGDMKAAVAAYAAEVRPTTAVAIVAKPTGVLATREEDIDAIPLETRPWPARPAGMLSHGVVADLLARVEEETEADPVAIAATFLVSFGSVVGRGPFFAVDGNRHGVNLFATIVGGTSEGRKGTSMSIVRAVFREIDEEWVRNCKTSSLTSGEGLIDLIRDDVYAVKENKQTGEPESYLSVPGVADKRLLFECQELAAVMRAGKQERSTLFPTLREAWDGQDLRTPTKNNPRKVTDPHVSGVCHITPEELAKLQTDADIYGGTWNRFLWVAARRARLCPHGGDFEDLRELQARVRSVVVNAQNVGRMRRTVAADRLWEREYFRRAECPPGGVVGAILGRAEAQILRLSMLAALCRGESVIDEVDLAAALDLWRYVDDTVRMLFGHGEDPLVSKIIAAVRAAPGISRSDLHRTVAKAMPAAQFVAALARAAAMGAIIPETVKTAGRDREVWKPREMQKVSKVVRVPPETFSPLSPFSPANRSEFGRTL